VRGNAQYYQTVQTKLAKIAPDLQGINTYRYGRQISWGFQEYMEAITFQHYLETQKLIGHEDAQANVTSATPEQGILLTIDDYLLGIFDMVGEVMRFAITAMATSGELPGKDERNVLADLRELRASLESLEVGKGTWFGNDVGKKMPVMQECVEKVEKALYGLTVRGAERPKGWMPDMDESRGREEIEGF
jgi:predicted translin family RNA/ssDNA-binding protein